MKIVKIIENGITRAIVDTNIVKYYKEDCCLMIGLVNKEYERLRFATGDIAIIECSSLEDFLLNGSGILTIEV